MNPPAKTLSAVGLKQRISELLQSSSLTHQHLQQMLDSFDIASLESESVSERKISSACICFLIYFVSRFGAQDGLLRKKPLFQFKLQAPFELLSSVLFVSGRKVSAESKNMVISRSLLKRQASKTHGSLVFSYMLSRLRDREPILIPVSLDRLVESLSKPLLVNTLPDPRHDCIYIDMKLGSHSEHKALDIEYCESRLFRPSTLLMNPKKPKQRKNLLLEEQSSKSFVESSCSLLKLRRSKLKASQASHTSIDCSELSGITQSHDVCRVSIVITPPKDPRVKDERSERPLGASTHSTSARKTVTAPPLTPTVHLRPLDQRAKEGFRLTSAKKPTTKATKSIASTPLKPVHRRSLETSPTKPSGFRLSDSHKLYIRNGLSGSCSKRGSMTRGQSALEQCHQSKELVSKLDGPVKQAPRQHENRQLLDDHFKSNLEETRSSKPSFFIVKRSIQKSLV